MNKPHSSNQWVLDVTTADVTLEVIHVDGPHHGTTKTVVFDPSVGNE